MVRHSSCGIQHGFTCLQRRHRQHRRWPHVAHVHDQRISRANRSAQLCRHWCAIAGRCGCLSLARDGNSQNDGRWLGSDHSGTERSIQSAAH
ncbi:Uncharacterised protein [Vibrio cholerae]|nr:Uncharacterised protein [Vibrio cholerae]